ncbi:winged helix-turn-helix transcriptional regulator [Rhodococcus sp. 2H158]|nr:HxlR family transcriptional regulator [Rhodococcus rhodochrous]
MTTTAGERREREKARYSIYLAGCPARQVLETLSNKWATLILSALTDGPRRHSELRRTIAGVSQKMLTTTLRTLERDGVVERTVTPSVPPRVDYRLTPLGESLVPIVAELKDWAESNIADILVHREQYDRATRNTG